MSAQAATKSEKVKVRGINLEVLRIAVPASAQAQPATSPTNSATPSPIVFLHEGLGSVALWRDFPKALCEATGRAGLVYSRRGYGQSDPIADVRGAGRVKPNYMHEEAQHVLPELLRIEGITQPILLGHSDGGTIALLHAARFNVEACIVMAPHLFVEDITVAAIAQARQAFESGELSARLAKHHADVDSAFWSWNDIWLSDAFRSFNIQTECKRITCPLLAIQGHDDPYSTMAQIDSLGSVASEISREIGVLPLRILRRVLLKLERCGHSPHKDQTQIVLSSITQWLAKNAPTP